MSIRQEVAAILMDYSDQLTDQVYRSILDRLANIPEEKDPTPVQPLKQELFTLKQKYQLLLDTLENTEEDLGFLEDRNYELSQDNLFFQSLTTQYLDKMTLYQNTLHKERHYIRKVAHYLDDIHVAKPSRPVWKKIVSGVHLDPTIEDDTLKSIQSLFR